MDRKKDRTHKRTISEYLRELFLKQALLTFMLLIVIGVLISLGSAKFSTDRFVRVLCSKLVGRNRILVEAYKTKFYADHYKELSDKLERKYPIRDLSIEENRPAYSSFHYSLGKSSIHWKSDLTADLYLKTFWAGNSIYVKATVSPRFQRNDLLIFFIAITLLLFASYYWGTRRILRKMKKRIIDPVGETWEGIRTGKSPKDLSLREIHDLWFSIEEYKVLARKKHRTEIARLFYHDLKRPVQFYSNRFLMLQKVKSYEELKEDIALTIEQGKLIESDMQRTMRKIAKDDYGRHMKPCSLRDIADKHLRGCVNGEAVAWGDKTMLDRVFENLVSNALKASLSHEQVSIELKEEGFNAWAFVRNFVKEGSEVQSENLFREGYSTSKGGTGMGLLYCKAVVELHKGSIEAAFDHDKRLFEVRVVLPINKQEIDKSTT